MAFNKINLILPSSTFLSELMSSKLNLNSYSMIIGILDVDIENLDFELENLKKI